ncbi:MAG: DUF1579 domain-containing protein, partial [Pirellulaceae bacterium]|nr:DUF1579 domain-containing protein [Pirellulaceae bacterium]
KPGFEGMGLIGYDNGRKKYTSIWACSMGTGICTGLGAADESGKKFTFHTKSYCPMEKKVVKGREEVRLESDNKVVMESYVIDDEGKETKVMKIVTVRKNGDTE